MRTMTRLKPDSLALGLALVALGVIWTLGNLGHLDTLSTIRTWWPMALIVWGVLELYETLAPRAADESPDGPPGARD